MTRIKDILSTKRHLRGLAVRIVGLYDGRLSENHGKLSQKGTEDPPSMITITLPSNETGRKDEQQGCFLPTRATKFQRHRIEQKQALEDAGQRK